MSDINMIQIHELNEASSVAATDVLAIDTGNATLKLKASKLTTGVKGNAESTYRTGNVNLTPANIGAVNKAGDTMTGWLTLPNIEMKPSSGGGFIDFHYDGSTADFTVRLMEYTQGVLSIRAAGENAYYPIITTKDVREKALYSTVTTGITAYPTAAGLYRLTGTLPAGMPTGANAYGVLLICGAGEYYMHIYAEAGGNVYIAEKGSAGAPATWRKVTTTNVAPIS